MAWLVALSTVRVEDMWGLRWTPWRCTLSTESMESTESIVHSTVSTVHSIESTVCTAGAASGFPVESAVDSVD